MPAAYHILEIDAGEDWVEEFQFYDDANPIDLTGYSGRMQVRESTDSDPALATISTAGGGMEIRPEDGAIRCSFTNVQTTAMASDNIDHVRRYDIELTSPTGKVVPFLFGKIKVRANATR